MHFVTPSIGAFTRDVVCAFQRGAIPADQPRPFEPVAERWKRRYAWLGLVLQIAAVSADACFGYDFRYNHDVGGYNGFAWAVFAFFVCFSPAVLPAGKVLFGEVPRRWSRVPTAARVAIAVLLAPLCTVVFTVMAFCDVGAHGPTGSPDESEEQMKDPLKASAPWLAVIYSYTQSIRALVDFAHEPMDRIARVVRLDREMPSEMGVPRDWMLRLEAFCDEYWLLHDRIRAPLAFVVHCGLLAAGFKADWAYAQLSPVLNALVVVWTMPHWTRLKVMAPDLRWIAFRWACAAVDVFGLLYVASTVHSPMMTDLGSMPLFGSSDAHVPWLAGLWCWKLVIFDVPIAIGLVLVVCAELLRELCRDGWLGTLFAGTVVLVIPAFLPMVTSMVMLPMVFFHTQILNVIGHPPKNLARAFPFLRAVPAADAEERSRRLNHLVRCAAAAALYDHCGFENAPWRRSTAAFADARVQRMIERGVSNDGAMMAPEVKQDADRSPVTWADQRVRPGRFFAPIRALLSRRDGVVNGSPRDGLGWRLDSWSLVGRVLELTHQGSRVAFPTPATFWTELRAPAGPAHTVLKLIAAGWMLVRTLCIPTYVVAAVAVGALPHHDVLQGVCLALVVGMIIVILFSARDAVDCDTITAVGSRLDCDAATIAAYSDVTPGEALAARVFDATSAAPAQQHQPPNATATVTLPLAVVQDVGAFLRRDDVGVHAALPTAHARRDARGAAHAAGYTRDDTEGGLTAPCLASPATFRDLPNPNAFGWVECFDRAADRGCESELWPLVLDAASGTLPSDVDRTTTSGDTWLKDTVAAWNERVDVRLALAGPGDATEDEGNDAHSAAVASNDRGDVGDDDDDGSLVAPLLPSSDSAPNEVPAGPSASPAALESGPPGTDPGATGGIGPIVDYTPRMRRVLLRRIAQLVPSATAESQRRFLTTYARNQRHGKAWEWQVIAALQYRVAGVVVPEPRVRPLHGFDDT